MFKIQLLFFVFIFALPSTAQTIPTEIGVVFENDLYTSTLNDKYYTNGLEVFYRFLNKKSNEKVNKIISEFRIGQHIYNPQTIKANDLNKNDRPFAGYLFFRGGWNTYYQNESMRRINFQMGYVGLNAFGEEIQKLFHKTFGYSDVEGWQYQIQNTLALQSNLYYSKNVVSSLSNQHLDLQFVGDLNLGTISNGISVGFLSRISLKKLLPVYNSNLYNGSLNSNKKVYKEESEFYFYINPNINYQWYDATIQGSLFNDNSPVTFSLMPFRFNGEAGLKYKKNNWNLNYNFVYKGKEAKNNVIIGYFYGSIGASYLLN